MKQRLVVVFDFDGTITSEDSLLKFILFTKGYFSFWIGLLLYSPYLFLYKLRLYPNWKIKQKIFSYFFRGISLSEFITLGELFSDKLSEIIRPKALEMIGHYQRCSASIYIVSASIDKWILPWASKVGIYNVLGTQVEIDSNGCLTGRFLTHNCYGQEKVNRLMEQEPDRGSYILYAYGDSRGDREIIEFADEGWYNKFV